MALIAGFRVCSVINRRKDGATTISRTQRRLACIIELLVSDLPSQMGVVNALRFNPHAQVSE
jgi:hypothetical protein